MWPLSALAAWAGGWLLFAVVGSLGGAQSLAFACATVLGAIVALGAATPWRRVFVGAGFPLSFAASGAAATLPSWAWLVALAVAGLALSDPGVARCAALSDPKERAARTF